MGQPLNRIDGRAKVTGAAKYAAEYNQLPGLVHAVLKTSDVARGHLTAIHDGAARLVPGVLAILTRQSLPPLDRNPGDLPGNAEQIPGVQMSFLPLTADDVYYANQPVALVVADTLEHAQQAATLLQVQVAAAPPVASYQDPSVKLITPTKGWTAQVPPARSQAEAAFASAPIQLTGTYPHAINHHNPLEPGATVAYWEAPDRLLVYDATQGITWTQQALSALLGLPQDQVRVVGKYIGGGFCCKGSVWPRWGLKTR